MNKQQAAMTGATALAAAVAGGLQAVKNMNAKEEDTIPTREEFENLRFQFETLKKKTNNGRVTRKYLPYVFTEQGIAMLAGVLKSDIAVNTSINIIKAFIAMRNFLRSNGQVFERLTSMEYKLLEHDKKFDLVFDKLQERQIEKQRIFFNGQIYDAYNLIIDIIKNAETKITIIVIQKEK